MDFYHLLTIIKKIQLKEDLPTTNIIIKGNENGSVSIEDVDGHLYYDNWNGEQQIYWREENE